MLPLLYHTHHSLQSDDLPFWLTLARQQGGTVLELGCGTGRLYWELVRAGFEVVGLDLDPEMLAFLQANPAPGAQESAAVFLADMSTFGLAQRFSFVMLPCNTLSILPSPTRRLTFERVRMHLLPGGLFAASMPNPALLLSLPEEAEAELEDTFLLPGSEDPVQVSSAWQRDQECLRVWWHYDLLFGDGRVKRYTLEAPHRLDPLQHYLDEMAAAGLEPVALYGDYDLSLYSDESPLLIILARVVPEVSF